MNIKKGFIVFTLLAAAAGWPVAAEFYAPYRDMRDDGAYVDWLDGHAGITGRSVSFLDLKLRPYYLQAKEAAEENGRTRLLSFLRELPIDGHRRLGDDPSLVEKVKRALEKTTAASVEVSGRTPTLTALLKVPLHGDNGILSLVLAPPASGEVAAAAAPASSAADGTVGDAHTGLILDASKTSGAAPSLLPRIVDEKGRAVYALELVDPIAARAGGLAAFATRVEVKEQRPVLHPLEGANPLRVEAVGLTDRGGTEFVVSAADADMILKAAAASPFLKECRVLILMPPVRAPAPQHGAVPALHPPQPKPPAKPRELEKPR